MAYNIIDGVVARNALPWLTPDCQRKRTPAFRDWHSDPVETVFKMCGVPSLLAMPSGTTWEVAFWQLLGFLFLQ